MQNFINKEKYPVLKDLINYNLKIIFCGMALGKLAAELQQYYPHQRNRFWNIMREAEFIDENITSKEYKKLINHELGLTDLVKNQFGGDKNIIVTDDDRSLLEKKIRRYKPKIFAFNGKKSAKKFFHKRKINYGEISNIGQTSIWVLESTSPAANRWWNNGKHWKQLAQKIKKIC